MTRAIRWRIIVLQLVAVLVLGCGAFGAAYASAFTTGQIHDQLAPQQIFFPKDATSGLPANLAAYAGQQVLTGDQAHAYADRFIGRHLAELGQGHPYSYWSGQAIADRAAAAAASDAAAKAQLTAQAAKEQGTADTLFKGETLRSLLNQAWTFAVIAQLAFYAALGLALAGLVVLGALLFEVLEAVRGGARVAALALPVGTPTATREPAAVN